MATIWCPYLARPIKRNVKYFIFITENLNKHQTSDFKLSWKIVFFLFFLNLYNKVCTKLEYVLLPFCCVFPNYRTRKA